MRLARAAPSVFPAAVLAHAFARPMVPPLPRLAMESYWRHHPIRADRLARQLARLSGAPAGWAWTASAAGDGKGGRGFRYPPAPFRDPAYRLGPGHCCVCGQPVYRFGWHRDLWDDGRPNARAQWHACCVAAWKLWTVPNDHRRLLSRLQRRRCAITGQRLLRGAEVDHRVPLYAVWKSHRDRCWPDLLAFWGFPNLQAINRPAHAVKSAAEAGHRAQTRMALEAGGAPAL